MAELKAENLVFSYDKKIKVIDGVSFSLKEGEYLAVIGRNGSGKSTLAKLLNGLLTLDDGNVTVDGFSVREPKDLYEIRKRVGMVFQNPDNQLVASIVEDDVAFGPENIGVPRKEIGERIDFALKSVGMEDFRTRSPERLSGGQKQRIAIAGVLALKPEILVFDESTSMLDPKGRKEVLEVVKKLNEEQGVSVLTITHYMEETVEADRIIVLDGGKIALEGTPKEVFSQKDKIRGLGLELPPCTVIAEKLKEKGLDINENCLTPDELRGELCKLSRKI